MCGRFVQERSITELAELFDAEPLALDDDTLATARYNLAPTDPAAVVVERADGRRAVTAYRWGLVPHWSTSPRDGARMINARAETVASLPAYRDSFRRRRCIVPADAFYEWAHPAAAEGAAGTAGAPRPKRQPFLIRRTDRRPLAFAGLWATWRDPTTDERRRTFTIVTRRANDAIASLHDRMPVIVEPEDWALWLTPDAVDPVALHAIIDRPPEVELVLVAVGPLVNNVRNQGPELIEPLSGDR
jgi:putative SOS response-associated peptidase YedK